MKTPEQIADELLEAAAHWQMHTGRARVTPETEEVWVRACEQSELFDFVPGIRHDIAASLALSEVGAMGFDIEDAAA